MTKTINPNPTIKNYSKLGSETIVSFRCVSYSDILHSCLLNNYAEMFLSVINAQICLW
jgi:hypothetical protein